jgi:hypothetical protein
MYCNEVACNPEKGNMGKMFSAAPRFVRCDDFWLDDCEMSVSVLTSVQALLSPGRQVHASSCTVSLLCLRCLSMGLVLLSSSLLIV